MQDLKKPMTYKGEPFNEFADTFPLYKHAEEAGIDTAELCASRCKLNLLSEKGISSNDKLCMQQCYVKFFDAVLTLKYQLEYRSESVQNLA